MTGETGKKESMPVYADRARRLSNEQAREGSLRNGPGELPAAGRRGAWGLLRDVVREPMFLMVVACGATCTSPPHEAEGRRADRLNRPLQELQQMVAA